MNETALRTYFDQWTGDLDRRFLRFGGAGWSRREFLLEIDRLAVFFESYGARAGKSVALALDNSPLLLSAALAAQQAGCVVVPLNPRYSHPETAFVLEDSVACLLIAENPSRPAFPVRTLLRREIESTVQSSGSGRIEDLTRCMAEWGPEPDQPSFLLYTSGTTSRPKGVLLTHGNVQACLESLREAWCWDASDRLLLALPLYHVHGLIVGAYGSIWNGSEIVLHPQFEPAAVWKQLKEESCTLLMGVPTLYQRLLQHAEANPEVVGADRPCFPQARLFISGSAPLPASLHRKFEERLGISILERYGMTETLMVLSNPCQGERKAGSVGTPLPGTEVCLMDDSGNAVQPGETGELWVRGPAVFSSYWNLPDATSQAFEDGWFKTGDMARQDSDGYYFIAGRRSVDILKSGGFKVSALEIEEALLALPSVVEAAVVGMPDEDLGEAIVAFIQPASSPGRPPAGEIDVQALGAILGCDLGAHLESRLARYKHPVSYVLVDQIPRNAMGKISKVELKKRGRSASGTAAPALD